MTTNRNFYRFIADLAKRKATSDLTLQHYLERLRLLAQPHAAREAVPYADFILILEAAFEPVRGDSSGTNDEAHSSAASGKFAEGYLAWEQLILHQIRDLREMKEAKSLDNKYRYFGIDAPRGGRWYNVEPSGYLECGAAGAFGGWEEGDGTNRVYVPGPVAVLDASGAVTTVDPRDIEPRVDELLEITWEQFVDFLEAGQTYE